MSVSAVALALISSSAELIVSAFVRWSGLGSVAITQAAIQGRL